MPISKVKSIVYNSDTYLFWSSFFEGWFNWIFLTSNHMLSPTFSSCELCLFLSDYFFMTSFAISINLFASSQLLPNFFIVLQENLLTLIILSSLSGFSFIDIFQNWVQMGYVLLLHISCRYTGILPLITILFNCFADSSHNFVKTLWLPN